MNKIEAGYRWRSEACATGSARRRIHRLVGCGLLAFGTFGLGCRKLTAEPAKGGPAKGEAAKTTPSLDGAEWLYDGSLKAGWQDWGWGAHDLSAGAARINLSQYGGWILHHEQLSTRFDALVFRMKAPAGTGEFLQVRLANGNGDDSFPSVEVNAERSQSLPDGWREVVVPWTDLNPKGGAFDRLTLHAKANVNSEWVLFDKLALTKRVPVKTPARVVNLSVACNRPGIPISPGIYGVAGDAVDTGATSRRWGGNTTTRYNWQAGVTNVGKDWYFENGKADYQKFIEDSRLQQTTSAVTIPTIGWVAKDGTSVGFPISVYGPQRARDPYKSDAGDGARADGTPVTPKTPTQTSMPAPPELMQRWVTSVVQSDQRSHTRSIHQYILDNEPSLWSSNHRDVHPDPLTYDELLDRTIRYGSAIRTADPGAIIAGPAEWGWTAYFYSASDAAAGTFARPDRRAHGDLPMVPWLLKKVHEHDLATGIKILDVLDLHFYPQAQGVWSPASDEETAALRLRSTRALWDPKYKDESWINDTVRLIPRMKEWVAQNYPGLKVSIGEWNFGAEQHISGGLAVAEVLGRFGTQGLDYAYYWGAPPKGSAAYWGFRAYRNFDGQKGHFLEQSLDTRMTDDVSLFASRDESGKHVVLVALNLNPTSVARANIALNGCSPLATRRKWSYDAQASGLVEEGARNGGNLSETLAPYSINVFDITLK